MTKIIIAAVIVVVMGGLVANAKYGQPVEVTNVKLENEQETVETVDCMDVVGDEDACKAAQDVIDRKSAEAELDVVEGNLAALRATFEAEEAALNATYKEKKDALVTEQERLEKELNLY